MIFLEEKDNDSNSEHVKPACAWDQSGKNT